MRWLRRAVVRWLSGPQPDAAAPIATSSNGMLGVLASEEHSGTVMVAPIRNGFLVCRRTYNPQGPDRISAQFASDADTLASLLVAEMAAARLTK